MTVGFALSRKGYQALADAERAAWITLAEAARIARTSVATIAYHIDTGELSWRHGIGSTLLVDREDIELRMVNGALRC